MLGLNMKRSLTFMTRAFKGKFFHPMMRGEETVQEDEEENGNI